MTRIKRIASDNRELSSVEIKKELMRVLRYFDRVCRDNDIKYSLSSGSLIGAVRHHGIIPWDDDIDVNMSIKEYKKLIKALKANPDPDFKLFMPGDKNYPYPFAKISATNTRVKEIGYKTIPDYGIYVDIFVNYFMPKNPLARLLFWYRAIFLKKGIGVQNLDIPFANYSKKQKAAYYISRIFHINYEKALIVLYSRLPKKPSKYVCNNWPCYSRKGEFQNAEDFDEYIDVDFEGMKAMITKKYDSILRRTYGDYMQLPPKEKRVSVHHFKAYYK